MVIALTFSFKTEAQETTIELPYSVIPVSPVEYNEHTVAARMIDGLGFRYYWATEGLREEDLNYQPSETSRTTLETIVHIYNLSNTIVNSTLSKPNVRGGNTEEYNFYDYRKMTLQNFEKASNNLKDENVPAMNDLKIIFQRGERNIDFPFWNMINGPIADAIWHTGQVVAFRRASGNPLPPGVSVFNGTKN